MVKAATTLHNAMVSTVRFLRFFGGRDEARFEGRARARERVKRARERGADVDTESTSNVRGGDLESKAATILQTNLACKTC